MHTLGDFKVYLFKIDYVLYVTMVELLTATSGIRGAERMFFNFKDGDLKRNFHIQKASQFCSNNDSSMTSEGVNDATEMRMKRLH